MNHKFEEKGGRLFIDGHEVIKGFESFNGWYWFAFELDHVQDSDMGNGQILYQDKIYFGLVQGQEEELGYFSEGEILALGNRVWEIPKKNLPFSGRRS